MAVKISKYLVAAAVSSVTFLLYLPSLRNQFVDQDDIDYVLNNMHIRSLDSSLFKWAFLDFYAANWHPLTWISHALDYALWVLDPLGHHLTNNVLHAANTFLVVVLLAGLLETWKKARTINQPCPRSDWNVLIAAGTTGLLFGLHPVHVESVAWISERKDLLCALFFLAALFAYMRYANAVKDRAPQAGAAGRFFDVRYMFALGFFILALLSKPMAVSLPVVLLILDWVPFGRIRSLRDFRDILFEKTPFLALSLLSSAVTLIAQKSAGATAITQVVPLTSRLLLAARSLVQYLWNMIWPVNLLPYYPYPRNIEFLSIASLLPLALIVVAVGVVLRRKLKVCSAAFLYYCVTLLPVLGIVQVGGQAMADRYTYLPSLGPFLLPGLLAAWTWAKTDTSEILSLLLRSLGVVLALSVLSSLAYLTFKQIETWKDDVSLWGSIIEKSPSSNLAYFRRGMAFHKKGRHSEAIADYSRSIDLEPFHWEAFYLRGAAYAERGMLDEAVADYTTTLFINPSHVEAYRRRGIAHYSAGRFDRALEDLDKEIAVSPSANAYIARGTVFLKTGNRERALSDFRTACDRGAREACDTLKNLDDAGPPR